jgi:4-hydroxybutyrate dehydrogenase
MALIYYLTHIHLEFGARKLLAAECERVGIQKAVDRH